jgi:hypothetical protein
MPETVDCRSIGDPGTELKGPAPDRFQPMTTTIEPEQLRWFRAWVEQAAGEPGPAGSATCYAPEEFGRVVVVRHPGTEVVAGLPGRVPFRGDPGEEGEPAPAQKRVLERLLLDVTGAGAPATLASYDPLPGQPGPLPAEAVRVGDPDHIDYLLLGGELAELTYTPWERRWAEEQQVTVLWPNDRQWWLHSDPDSSFTVVGCDDSLADRLLDEPVLRAVTWPGRERGSPHG